MENWRKFLIEQEEIDPADYIDFKRGDCSLFASVAADILKFPIYGVFDKDGVMHHVFVYKHATKEAIDCRGIFPVEKVFQGIIGDDLYYQQVTQEQIEKQFGTYSDEEYQYAEEEVESII